MSLIYASSTPLRPTTVVKQRYCGMGQVLPWLPLGPWLVPLVQRDASEGDRCALLLSSATTLPQGPTSPLQGRPL